MNYYETVYIIHPALQEGRLNDIVDKFQNKLKELKGKNLYVNNWGKKKLAYPIDKQKYGTYILCQYSLDGEHVKIISQDLELNPNILRFLTSKIDQSQILEGPNKLNIEDKKEAPNNKDSKNTEEIATPDNDTEEIVASNNEKKEIIESNKDAMETNENKDDDNETSSTEEK